MTQASPCSLLAQPDCPRLGFLGVGWIGRHRLDALARSGAGCVAAIADTAAEETARAAAIAPEAAIGSTLDDLLAAGVDGIVIATPSALHAEQAVAALEAGAAVFCQKPLARTASEARRVVDAARAADRLLGVDLSYRQLAATLAARALVSSGSLGRVYAADLEFHNAYGPDKAWFRDPALSGGGCVMDLMLHLVDLALWMLDDPSVADVSSRLYAGGSRIAGRAQQVEDFAVAQLDLAGGGLVRLASSWNLPAGSDAVIGATFYGTKGGVVVRNVNGSFYDFTADLLVGTARTRLASPPDDWGGRALVAWARTLALDPGFDRGATQYVRLAEVLDRIYAAA
ncbi:MAG: Gfo/Idh/MocA family oxidoreductase [Gemmatimonadales bacterium]|nr:Gfo/Idh/MocA family oxidoreductase [Gemmatimonadales bacterium]